MHPGRQAENPPRYDDVTAMTAALHKTPATASGGAPALNKRDTIMYACVHGAAVRKEGNVCV